LRAEALEREIREEGLVLCAGGEGKQPERITPLRSTKTNSRFFDYCAVGIAWPQTVAMLLRGRACIYIGAVEYNEGTIRVLSERSFKDDAYTFQKYKREPGTTITMNNKVITTYRSMIYKDLVEPVVIGRDYTKTVYVSGNDTLAIVHEGAYILLHNADTFCGPGVRYRIIPVDVPKHVAILLWDTEKRRVELFDSGGVSQLEERDWVDIVPFLFPIGTTLVVANRENLQEAAGDIYCQTWVWYYVYHRVLGERAGHLVRRLQALSSARRMQEIQLFWNFLLLVQDRPELIPRLSFTDYKAQSVQTGLL
jgi:hypothetical protein